MASFQMRQRDPLVDPNMQAMLERRARELIGIGLIFAALLFTVMLASYSPADPSWMSATDQPVQNWLGRIGAAIGSTLMIIAGKGAWALPLILLAWGVRFMAHRGGERAIGRVVFAVIAVAFAAVHCATLVPGDAWMLLASLLWAWYSWLLARPGAGAEPAAIKADWAAFLLAQIVMGLVWSGLLTAGEWWTMPEATAGQPHIVWGWTLAAGLLYVALGPSLLAYRCWGAAVTRVGPAMASVFSNLTPLFAALMSATLLGEPPSAYHALGFVLIVGGILVSSRR